MSILLAVALAAAIQPSCSWEHPDSKAYSDIVAAIDHRTDLTPAQRLALKERLDAECSELQAREGGHQVPIPKHLKLLLPPDTDPALVVPEPETWAMLLAGIGLVGWQARRHKAQDRD